MVVELEATKLPKDLRIISSSEAEDHKKYFRTEHCLFLTLPICFFLFCFVLFCFVLFCFFPTLIKPEHKRSIVTQCCSRKKC